MFRRSARNAKTSPAGRAIVTVFWSVCIVGSVSCPAAAGRRWDRGRVARSGRLLPGERADLAGGLGELAAVADAGELAALRARSGNAVGLSVLCSG